MKGRKDIVVQKLYYYKTFYSECKNLKPLIFMTGGIIKAEGGNRK